MSWELIRYDDFTIPLISTDIDEMEKNGKIKDTEKSTKKSMDIDDITTKTTNDTEAVDPSLEKTIKSEKSETDKVNGVGEISKNENEETMTESTSEMNDDNIKQEENDEEEEDLKKNSGDGTEGKFLALKIQFQLPSSCYATTALRELLSCDSSFQAQSQLNANFNKKTEQNGVK